MPIWMKKIGVKNIAKYKNLLLHIKMGKEIITFGDIEIEKHKLHRYKNPFFKWCRNW